MAGSWSDVNEGSPTGIRSGDEPSPVGDRASVVAMKRDNARGAKGGREANAPRTEQSEEERSPKVPPQADKQGEEDLWQRHKAERGVWSKGMLEALQKGVKGNKWFSLIDKVYADKTLELAWAKVRSNAGACGVDGMTVGLFEKGSQKRLLALKEHIMEGSYHPEPVKRVWIPKPGSAQKRPLGIPTVGDRVVQTALRMVIEPIFERQFAPQSYGFRPGRSCHDALRRVEELLKESHSHVVEIDIKGYFDAIPHERLMKEVGEHVADGRVLAHIEAFLKQGVMGELNGTENETGTPQGGVVSPLLANIYLNPLDWLMEQSGLQMVRYADDMVVLCQDRASAEHALKLIAQWMKEAGLEMHPEKTRIVAMTERGSYFDFLGYRFWRGQGNALLRLIRPKSRKKLKERLKPLTRRNSGKCMEAIIQTINPILLGWYGYFKHAKTTVLGEEDGWLRKRLRSILRKRRKLQGCARGNDNQRWPNRYFSEHGLFCLEAARVAQLASLRGGATC